MPCSCGGMRRSGLAPNQSNIAIRQNQPKQIPNVQQYYSPPAQIPRPTQPSSQPQTQTAIPFQSNRPNFSGNLPRRR
jgi:hypothetical protein